MSEHSQLSPEASCGCETHPKHIIGSLEAPVNVNLLFDALFRTSDDIVTRIAYRRRECSDVVIEPWAVSDSSNCEFRVIYCVTKYKVPFNVYSQYSKVIEEQVIIRSLPSQTYVVSASIATPEVPYGETFRVKTRYCFTASSSSSSRLFVSSNVHFYKWNLFSKKIEALSVDASISFFSIIKDLLFECDFDPTRLALSYERSLELIATDPSAKSLSTSSSSPHGTHSLLPTAFSPSPLKLSSSRFSPRFLFSAPFLFYSFALLSLLAAFLNAFVALRLVSLLD